MIQMIMLAALGFLFASLLALVVAPAFHARAVRLTTKRIRDSLPLSEAEMRADKDLMRAEYAVKVHQLEKQIDQSKLSAHRQFIDINRRDAALKRLREESERLQADLEENQNARRVLEQTINDRLPKLEGRLDEARGLIRARDQEIGALGHEAERQAIAFNEAHGINAQLQSEIERLQTYLSDMQGRDRRRGSEAGHETDFALRTELESLRSKARDQASLIDRLQSAMVQGGQRRGNGRAAVQQDAETDVPVLRGKLTEQAAEIRGLQQAGAADAHSVASHRLRELEQHSRDQADEIERLKAELDLARSAAAGDTGVTVKESRSFLKSKLERSQSDAAREHKTVMRLRAELAAANERAARQAAQFMEEMRRLSARSISPQRGGPAPAATRGAALTATRPRPTRAEAVVTINAIRPDATSRARELQRTLEASFSPDRMQPANRHDEAAPMQASPAPHPPNAAAEPDGQSEAGDRRPRLLDRLRNYDES